MIKVDIKTMWIYITRGDSAIIVFSAENEDGESFHPSNGDKLIFKATKKMGDEESRVITIENEMDGNEEEYWSIKFKPEDTKNLAFGKYPYDVEINICDNGEVVDVDTIIGKTDTLSPTLVIWGEA
jgi:hypothetical protein